LRLQALRDVTNKKNAPLPGLNMSRSLGDLIAKQAGVISAPHKAVHLLQASDRALVLASDGLWDFVGNDETSSVALSTSDAWDGAARLSPAQALLQPAVAAAWVAAGHELGVYHCIEPSQAGYLNTFIERDLIEARLLFWFDFVLGVSSHLYYDVALWANWQAVPPFWAFYTTASNVTQHPGHLHAHLAVAVSRKCLQLFKCISPSRKRSTTRIPTISLRQ
jgi:hypothetical protein